MGLQMGFTLLDRTRLKYWVEQIPVLGKELMKAISSNTLENHSDYVCEWVYKDL